MYKLNKKTLAIYIFIILTTSLVMWLCSINKHSATVNNQDNNTTPTLETIPDCETTEDSLDIKEWKTYTDKYNKFSVSIPKSSILFKGPLDYMTDEEYQKTMYRPDKNSFDINFSTDSNQSLSMWIELNRSKCIDVQSCTSDSIANTKYPYSISCKTIKEINDGEALFFKIHMDDKQTGKMTYWTTYKESDHGILKFSFGNKGDKDYPYHIEFTKIIDSFKFTK